MAFSSFSPFSVGQNSGCTIATPFALFYPFGGKKGESGPTLPHVADANARLSLTAEGVVLSGGLTIYDGLFRQRGIFNGKPYYRPANAAHDEDPSVQPDTSIAWDSNVNQWIIGQLASPAFTSDSDVDRPDLATWNDNHGVPTVTHSPGQVTGAGYQVIQDSNSTTYEFNGDGTDSDAGLVIDDVPYSVRGTANGKNYYNVVGEANDPALGAVTWDGAQWQTLDDAGAQSDFSTDDVALPWNATGWSVPPLRNPIASPANWTTP